MARGRLITKVNRRDFENAYCLTHYVLKYHVEGSSSGEVVKCV